LSTGPRRFYLLLRATVHPEHENSRAGG
jgi:hypothetical protein